MRGNNLPVIGALVLSLTLAGCDLLVNKPEIDMEQALDKGIAYANAARLTAEVYYPESWGRSPQFGPLNPDDVRQGFPFTVEFTVSAAYGFTEWRAYRTAELGNKNQAALERAAPLTAAEAVISGNTDGRASITINITEPVTLIPWCEDRPRVTQSNPPLVNSGISYTRGQQIKIWFATPLDPSTVQFGVGLIEITGQHTITGNSEPYDDPSTPPNENGDLTGRQEGSTRFFQNPEYDPAARTITIKPEPDALPPGEIVITVTVGTGIKSPNGNGMAGPVNFYYRTNMLEAKNVYIAENIWAIHNPGDSPSAEKFFYTGADTGRDWRLRKNTSGKYEVTLYFTVQASNSTEMTDQPNRFKIAELHYANLGGAPAETTPAREQNWTAGSVETSGGTADAIYRQSNSGARMYYKIRYEWPAAPQPRIIRLIVLPYRDADGDGDYSDQGDTGPDTWGNAHAEGRFAMVVLDDKPPSGNAIITAADFAGQSSSTGGLTQYNYGISNKILNFTANFSNVADNGGDGIELNRASMDKPWTMDNSDKLQWQYQIVDTAGTAYPSAANLNAASPAGDAAWKPLSADPMANAVTGLDLSRPEIGSKNKVRDLNFRYRDALGNLSPWSTRARISYYEDNLLPVTSWDAAYNPDANTITVNWTNPTTDFVRATASYTVDGGSPIVLSGITNATTGGGGASAVIYGAARLDASAVRNGMPVSGARRYDITIQAHSNTSQRDTTFKIWNFGTPGAAGSGMSVSDDYPAEEIGSQTELAAMATNNANKKYVLANNISLGGAWTPIGTNASAFRGTFYGNGHTITVGSGFSNAAHTGIFGYTSSALIRDLAVAYSSSVTAGSSATNIGGIAGYAGGTTVIRNCVVSGAGGVTLQKNGTSAALGGMAGYMEPGAVIVNGSSSLNVRLESSSGEAWAGGAVGKIAAGGNGSVTNIEAVSVSGNVSLVKTGNARMHVGGVVGASVNHGWIKNVSFSGTVGASTSSAVLAANALGGIAGSASGTSFDGCIFTGTIKTPIGGVFEAGGGTDTETRIGGIAGYYTTGGVSNPRMWNSTASGTFDITHNGSGTLSLGGVIGLANNKDNLNNVETGNKIEITNCRYEHGNIILERNMLTGNRYDQIGGFAGKIDPCDINNCGSLAGRIRVTGRSAAYAGSLWAGGFVSEIRTGSSVTNCYSASPVEAYNYSTAGRTDHRGMAVGGFVALVQFGGIINNCYASGDITAYAAGDRLAAGGFAGRADRFDQIAGNTIQSCYAAGNVYATSDRSTASTNPTHIDFAGGGFAGISIGTAISDCYALGDVFVEGGSAVIPVYAGGLSGYLADASNPGFTPSTNPGSIETCFAAGSVRAQSAEAAKVYAGGIVGYAASGTLQNNVARGALIQAKSDDATNRKAGRVYGGKSSTPLAINSNYGLKTMATGTGEYYASVSLSIPSSDIGHADMHGADVANNTSPSGIRTSSFWITTPGFDIAFWNFSDVGYRGYPYLSWQ
jgi:hypothetical protein